MNSLRKKNNYILSIGLFLLLGCDVNKSNGSNDDTITIRGKIFDTFDGESLDIPHAVLRINGHRVPVDSNAVFSYEFLGVEYIVDVTSYFHKRYSDTLSFSELENANLNIELSPLVERYLPLDIGLTWKYNYYHRDNSVGDPYYEVEYDFYRQVVGKEEIGTDTLFSIRDYTIEDGEKVWEESVSKVLVNIDGRIEVKEGNPFFMKGNSELRYGNDGLVNLYTHYPVNRADLYSYLSNDFGICCNSWAVVFLNKGEGFQYQRGSGYDYSHTKIVDIFIEQI